MSETKASEFFWNFWVKYLFWPLDASEGKPKAVRAAIAVFLVLVPFFFLLPVTAVLLFAALFSEAWAEL